VQTAGKFLVQTQIYDIANDKYYNIDRQEFDSNFLTQRGGISLTPGKSTVSNNYVTYYNGAVYTMSFNLANYIPMSGMLIIYLP
jgi:hypothetical protein